jgi:hypothetical protein
MWSSDDIKDRIEVIERDSRYLASLKKPADIRINAPLALIQMGYENEIRTLRTVLGEDYTTLK